MAEFKDPYTTLGVEKDAERDAIQKAYRKLARQFHPDLNPGDAKSEERFKEIANAWGVLSDEQKRRDYDEFGEISLEAGFDAEEARKVREQFGARFGSGGRSGGFSTDGIPRDDFHFGGIDDLLGQMFSQQGGDPRREMRFRGSDLEAGLELDFIESIKGAEKRLNLERPAADGRAIAESVTVRIPPGVSEKGKLRIPGKGAEGMGGGPAGDLWVSLRIRPHPVFRRNGRNLEIDLPVSVREATLGADIEIPTLDGKATLKVPPGTSGGARLRLRGQGVPSSGRDAAGDLLVRIRIVVPKDVDEAAKSALEELARYEDPEIRKELFQ